MQKCLKLPIKSFRQHLRDCENFKKGLCKFPSRFWSCSYLQNLETQIEINKKSLSETQEQLSNLEGEDKTCKSCDKKIEKPKAGNNYEAHQKV